MFLQGGFVPWKSDDMRFKKALSITEPEAEASLLAVNLFTRQAGISACTLWRWRKLGWLRTTNIAGRQYISSEDLAEFKRRAAAGEFSKPHPVPRPLAVSGRTMPH